MSATMYGIRNCTTVKKARDWLEAQGVDYDFHDYKLAGITPEKLVQWSRRVGWEALLNRAGMTFRKLEEADKAGLNEERALALMCVQPSLIKRPLLEIGGRIVLGFKAELYAGEVGIGSRSGGKKPGTGASAARQSARAKSPGTGSAGAKSSKTRPAKTKAAKAKPAKATPAKSKAVKTRVAKTRVAKAKVAKARPAKTRSTKAKSARARSARTR